MSHLIELINVTKTYTIGSSEVKAVNNVSLTIDAGEFVAIMGASGSGKSTMLNILGFLDIPTSGSYKVMGMDVSGFSEDELSILRNHIAGFIFQQFQLLPRLDATDNVLLPALYAGKHDMENNAVEKLKWVGLGHRTDHYPNELSGGEQQRVAISRSMINEPVIVFADEPTGNLDTKSESEIIAILKKLNDQGKTIIMVTHENEVASHAKRIIRMKDGVIISDKAKVKQQNTKINAIDLEKIESAMKKETGNFGRATFIDYIKQAAGSLISHKMRALLSMLGILIGVAAVISMLAIGEGAKASIEENLQSLGTNILSVRPGFRRSAGVSLAQGLGTRLSLQDADAFHSISGIKNISPGVNSSVQAIYGSKNSNTYVQGVSANSAEMKADVPVMGRFFTEQEDRSRQRVALIGQTVVENLFGKEHPIGKQIRLNKVIFTVIGVLPKKGAAMMRDQDDRIVIPIRTAMHRLFGKTYIDEISVEITSPEVTLQVQDDIKNVLAKRHRLQPGQESLFEVRDFAQMRETLLATARTLSILLGSVAAISLVVGGVGVMNIMLVSVKERTKEIGLRKAIGARRRDILLQFMIEAVMMTFSGGIAGIILGVTISLLFSSIAGWAVKLSVASMIGASFFSILVGMIFGIWPAVQASRLSPIEALRYD